MNFQVIRPRQGIQMTHPPYVSNNYTRSKLESLQYNYPRFKNNWFDQNLTRNVLLIRLPSEIAPLISSSAVHRVFYIIGMLQPEKEKYNGEKYETYAILLKHWLKVWSIHPNWRTIFSIIKMSNYSKIYYNIWNCTRFLISQIKT